MHLELKHSGGPFTLAQITDCHLGADPGRRLAGVNTRQSLERVLDAVAEWGAAELLLMTGDLADDGSAGAYRQLERQLQARFAQPQAWLPGNHDDLAAMQASVPARLVGSVAAGRWGVILLNSLCRGEVGGVLAPGELQRLAGLLEDPRWDFCLVCVHHHPVPIGSRWLDEQRIANADQLLAQLDASPKVKGVLWGHIHQAFDGRRGAVRLLGAPSTCVQFAPGSEDFRLDRLGPGWRSLRLHEDGSLETRVHRIAALDGEVDYACRGY